MSQVLVTNYKASKAKPKETQNFFWHLVENPSKICSVHVYLDKLMMSLRRIMHLRQINCFSRQIQPINKNKSKTSKIYTYIWNMSGFTVLVQPSNGWQTKVFVGILNTCKQNYMLTINIKLSLFLSCSPFTSAMTFLRYISASSKIMFLQTKVVFSQISCFSD